MKIFLVIISLSAALFSFNKRFTSSIYQQHFTSLSGGEINLSQYQGKKMLLVNMASESPEAAVQIPQMQQLYEQYHDSLVVIGFFSNDFHNEPREDNVLKLLMENNYHATFPCSVRIGVKDSTGWTHPLYNWLQHKTENGMMNAKITRDFQKYLVDTDGRLIGIFASRIRPTDPKIIDAITH